MIHAMIDIETLGTSPGSAILSVGAVGFDPESVTTPPFLPFYRNIGLASSLAVGCTVDAPTVQWWFNRDDEARGMLFRNALSLVLALDDLRIWYVSLKPSAVWANSPQFDLTLLREAGKKVGWTAPWHYRDERDLRTLLALTRFEKRAFVPTEAVGPIEHDALDDAFAQAKKVQEAYRVLRTGRL